MWSIKQQLILSKASPIYNLKLSRKMARAKDMELEQMSMGEIDEIEKKLVELKKQKMKEEKAAVIKQVRKLCMDYNISATQLRGALVTRERKKNDK